MKSQISENRTVVIKKEVVYNYREFITTLLSDGLFYFSGYGFYISYKENEYEISKQKLGLGACLEDIQAQMILDGFAITVIDDEGDWEYTTDLTLDLIESALLEHLETEPDQTFISAYDEVISGDYDADSCDIVMQYILFGGVMFS